MPRVAVVAVRSIHLEFVTTGSSQHVATGLPPLGLVLDDPPRAGVIEAGDLPVRVRRRRLGRRVVVSGFTSAGFVVRGPAGGRCRAVVYVDPAAAPAATPPDARPDAPLSPAG